MSAPTCTSCKHLLLGGGYRTKSGWYCWNCLPSMPSTYRVWRTRQLDSRFTFGATGEGKATEFCLLDSAATKISFNFEQAGKLLDALLVEVANQRAKVSTPGYAG